MDETPVVVNDKRYYLDPTKPLWLPDGSIRSIMALGLLGLVGIMLLLSLKIPEWIVGLVTLVVRDYFASKEKLQ